MSAYKTFACGNLFVVWYVAEETSWDIFSGIRGPHPKPRLFVIAYDEEHDNINIVPIEFRLARALVPDQAEEIRKFISLKRSEQTEEYKKAEKDKDSERGDD